LDTTYVSSNGSSQVEFCLSTKLHKIFQSPGKREPKFAYCFQQDEALLS